MRRPSASHAFSPDSRPRHSDAIRQDISYAIRGWARQPALAALIVGALSLGIGATTAIFSVVRAVILQPLPYGDPSTLALVWGSTTEAPAHRGALSPPDIMLLRSESRIFRDVAAVNSFSASIDGEGAPEQVQLGVITHNFFDVLGVQPLLGRNFTAADDTRIDTRDPRNVSVIILSHGYWAQKFGSDTSVLGRVLRVGGTPMIVVGILPESFKLLMPSGAGMSTDLAAWTPLRIDYVNAPRSGSYLKAVARLQPATGPGVVQRELDRVASRFRSEFPPHESVGFRLRAVSMHQDVIGHLRPVITALTATAIVLLVIGCTNASNLLLTRLAARQNELAIRAAMGGSRGRLAQQLLTESAVVALCSAVAGAFFAWAGVQLLISLQPVEIPRVETVAVDGSVFVFALCTAAFCTFAFGLAPSLLSSRANLAASLRERMVASRVSRRVRNTLVVAEVGLSLVLLVSAGLMLRSVVVLHRAELGFDPSETLTFRVALPFTAYPRPAMWSSFYQDFHDRLVALPGVEAAGMASALPTTGGSPDPFALDPAIESLPWGTRSAIYRQVDPGFFTTLRIAPRAGRLLAATDNALAPMVVVVDEALARKTWSSQPAVGQRLEIMTERFESGYRIERRVAEVVGVVGTVPHTRPDAEPPGTIYLAHAQTPSWNMAIAIRAGGTLTAIADAVRETLRTMNPSLPIYSVRWVDDHIANVMAPTRFVLLLLGVFAAVALALATVGLYSVVMYGVRQRTTELGLRLALGARPFSIAGGVMREGLQLAVVGVGLGALAMPWVTRLLDDVLVGVPPGDPVALAGAVLLIFFVVVAASLFPARRAGTLNPAATLRGDH